jgi:hypothetical protein
MRQKQLVAFNMLTRDSVGKHFDLIESIREKIAKIRLTKEDFIRMVRFIEEEAPIIIYFNFLDSIQHFVNDDHYRRP